MCHSLWTISTSNWIQNPHTLSKLGPSDWISLHFYSFKSKFKHHAQIMNRNRNMSHNVHLHLPTYWETEERNKWGDERSWWRNTTLHYREQTKCLTATDWVGGLWRDGETRETTRDIYPQSVGGEMHHGRRLGLLVQLRLKKSWELLCVTQQIFVFKHL